MTGASVHDNFKVSTYGETTTTNQGWDYDIGPFAVGRVEVCEDVERWGCVPDSAAVIVAVLKRESTLTKRVGEGLELLRVIWLIGLDPDVTTTSKGVGPEVFLILSGRSQHLREGAKGERATVLVFGNFSRSIVKLRDVLAKEVGEPEIVVLVGSHAEGRAAGRNIVVVGERVRLIVKQGDDVSSRLTEKELRIQVRKQCGNMSGLECLLLDRPPMRR